MARPLRIQQRGLWHHAMNRGMERRAIFIDDEDAEAFLSLVGDGGERWGVWCHAACLMSTHYHLLLHDEGGLLSRAMRHIDGVFTQFFNRRRGRDGSLMRGRYRSSNTWIPHRRSSAWSRSAERWQNLFSPSLHCASRASPSRR